ncbi:winged helix-turn-helix domain-containing protein [Nitrososphaera sp.]|uniref:winged helix-turn-helix domain-containing protein n=1 Tax=Nitrososphaera sp. TaxID=1971748 RepID=UPI00307D7207
MVKHYRREFEPSFRVICRILKILLERGAVSKTVLSQAAGINYSRLLRHLDWLDHRQIIELMVERHKVLVRLTRRGKEFALILSGNNRH